MDSKCIFKITLSVVVIHLESQRHGLMSHLHCFTNVNWNRFMNFSGPCFFLGTVDSAFNFNKLLSESV